MRVVRTAEAMPGAWDAARRESKNAFGDDAVYIEKYIEGPRHVEIQVLADAHGTVVALGERECSVQRRHQKMIEEAPSPAVDADLRRRMGAAAVRAARAAGYVNAGTCEFLLARNGEFYFLEMNTRIQVEHPVTELVTGIDLVQWQLRIAAGERIPFPAEIEPRGWAMECRLTSEDPANGFLPSTGRVEYLHVPSGPGVRWDGGIEAGSDIGLFYDPMLAKLIVWGATREQAVARMHRALLELVVDGIETSREFHLRVMEDAEFRAGAIDIQWLERRLPSLLGTAAAEREMHDAAIAAASGSRLVSRPNPWVGAVVVASDGRRFSGATEEPGSRHAEIVALDSFSRCHADLTAIAVAADAVARLTHRLTPILSRTASNGNSTSEGTINQKIWLESAAIFSGCAPSRPSQTNASSEVSGRDATSAANPVERLAISEIRTISDADIKILIA